MTDKLYTQKEVDELQRLAQAAALKEAAESITEEFAMAVIANARTESDSKLLCQPVVSVARRNILALSDQPLLAQHDDKITYKAVQDYETAHKIELPVTRPRAEAAAVMVKLADTYEYDIVPQVSADSVSRTIRAAIPTDYADALREREKQVRLEEAELAHQNNLASSNRAEVLAYSEKRITALRSEPAGEEKK